MNGRRLGFPLLRHLTSLSWNNPYLALQFQLQVELLLLMMMTKSRGGTSGGDRPVLKKGREP